MASSRARDPQPGLPADAVFAGLDALESGVDLLDRRQCLLGQRQVALALDRQAVALTRLLIELDVPRLAIFRQGVRFGLEHFRLTGVGGPFLDEFLALRLDEVVVEGRLLGGCRFGGAPGTGHHGAGPGYHRRHLVLLRLGVRSSSGRRLLLGRLLCGCLLCRCLLGRFRRS